MTENKDPKHAQQRQDQLSTPRNTASDISTEAKQQHGSQEIMSPSEISNLHSNGLWEK